MTDVVKGRLSQKKRFEILDDGDGKITIAEFSHGLMLLKGQARALDIMVPGLVKGFRGLVV